MAEASRSDRIIQPAPAQTAVSTSQQESPEATLAASKEAESRARKIKNLTKQLRMINNVCDPIRDFTKFQNFLSPDIRILLQMNQWVGLVYAFKAAIKSTIDDDYLDINDHPQTLKTAMEKTYTNIDSVCELMVSSMKEIITLEQSRLSQSTTSETDNILVAMNEPKESRLP